MIDIDKIAVELSKICYVDQLRSDAAFRKKREIKNVLMKFKELVDGEFTTYTKDLERRLYIAEKAVADYKLAEKFS